MALDKDVFYESRGRVVHPTWPKNFEDHETRLGRAWRRCSAAFGSLERTIASYLLTDGRIPGPLAGIAFREQLLYASKLQSGRIDFRLGLRVTLILDQASTTLDLGPPPLQRHEAVHVTLRLEQDDSGSRTVASYGDRAVFVGAAPAGSAPSLSTAAGSVNILAGYWRGTTGLVEFVASPHTGQGFPA